MFSELSKCLGEDRRIFDSAETEDINCILFIKKKKFFYSVKHSMITLDLPPKEHREQSFYLSRMNV